MFDFGEAVRQAAALVCGFDASLIAIIALSLQVSLSAVAVAVLLGLPVGAALAVAVFPGRHAIAMLMSALLGLPPVVAGLLVYLLFSRAGPLGDLGILFTPTAMVIAQAVLITPIIAALARQVIEDSWSEYRELMLSLGAGPLRRIGTLLWDNRYALVTVVLAGLGRACAEVGAVMIVGGNIDGVTRVMTTAIALETTKGDLPLALALGLILMLLVLALNAAAYGIGAASRRRVPPGHAPRIRRRSPSPRGRAWARAADRGRAREGHDVARARFGAPEP